MIEIERKFLVASEGFLEGFKHKNRIVQGYLCSDPEKTVRVRVKGANGYFTIKGKSNESGLSRMEWEREIDVDEAI